MSEYLGIITIRLRKDDFIMGWTSYFATEYRNGKVDRMAEFMKEFDNSSYADGTVLHIVKASIVGSTIYAAACRKRPEEDIEGKNIFCIVCLTSVQNGIFYFKDMLDTVGPYETKCPIGILKLLSPTNNECANEWRKKCYAYHDAVSTLRKMPVGSSIVCCWNDENVTLQKRYYQKGTIWWDGQYKYCISDIARREFRKIEN